MNITQDNLVEEPTPIELRDHTNDQEIPKDIHYIWIGGVMRQNDEKVGPIPAYRDGIQYTKRVLDPDYTIHLWLSKHLSINAEAYEENVEWATAMGLQIRNIDTELELREREVMVIEWERNTQKPNYGAISDILRLVILYQFGGIYMDTDCAFLKPPPDSLIPKYGVLFVSSRGNMPPEEQPVEQHRPIPTPKKSKSLFSCFSCCMSSSELPLEFMGGSFPIVGITNSVIGSVIGGLVIANYRSYIMTTYREVQELCRNDEQSILDYLYKGRDDGTLIRSGPEAMKRSTRIFRMNGENVYNFWMDNKFLSNEDRNAMVFPTSPNHYICVQYGNSWKERTTPSKLAKNNEKVEAPQHRAVLY